MTKPVIDLAQFSDVIATIYDCAVDPLRWPAAIEQVGALVHGINGVIMMIDITANRTRFYQDWNVDPRLTQIYAEQFHADNPLNDHFPKFDVDEPYNISMVMAPDDWLATRVYRDFGKPNGWLDSIGINLLKTPSRFATLSIARQHDVGFAGPREIEIMRLLAPHLRKAASISDLLDMRELTSKTFETTFDALAVPVIFVDEDNCIIHANVAARALLAAADLLRSERGVLTALVPDAARLLAKAVVACKPADSAGNEAMRTVFIPHPDGRPAFAHVLPMRLGTVRGGLAPRATAAVFLTPAANPNDVALLPWAAAFGLTATETRVLALIAEGRTIKDAASDLGMATTTARTHLARLMQKIGATRQAELVRMVSQFSAPLRRPER